MLETWIASASETNAGQLRKDAEGSEEKKAGKTHTGTNVAYFLSYMSLLVLFWLNCSYFLITWLVSFFHDLSEEVLRLC